LKSALSLLLREGHTGWGLLTSVDALRALAILADGHDDALAVLQLPGPPRQRWRTTNGVEPRNAEIRRRKPVICIFPNRALTKNWAIPLTAVPMTTSLT
jgi:hypothetical protein